MKAHLATAALVCIASGTSCDRHAAVKEARAPLSTLKIVSSDALIQVAAAWAEAYHDAHPNVAVTTSGGGSGTGIAGLLKGSVHIAATVRTLNETEEKQFIAPHGKLPKRTLIGYDAAAVCVHKDNPVSAVSLEDLRGIFAEGGRIGDWSTLGVNEFGPIIRLIAQSAYFRTNVFQQTVFEADTREFGAGLSEFNGSYDLVHWCAAKRGAIGFVGLGWTTTDKVKWLPIARERGGAAVEPSEPNIRSGRYPIARPLFFYTLDGAPDEAEAFVALALSAKGQVILRKEGFVTVTE